MAHNFLGTYNRTMFERFAKFGAAQLEDIGDRVLHLNAERMRLGALVFSYDSGGTPISFTKPAPDSYIGKLLACYEVLGGDVMFDLNVRTLGQPVFLLPGDETHPAQMMSNGEIMPLPGQADAPSALLMQDARDWIFEVLQYKREYLERKIMRALDYSDQLNTEIAALMAMAVEAKESPGSWAYLVDQLNQLLADPNYRATGEDHGKDPHGKGTYAPYAGLIDGPDRQPGDTWTRGAGGETLAPGVGGSVA